MSTITIISPGQLASVQDLGRKMQGSIGVSMSGAADAMSLRLGNRLIGNHDDAAALEMTFTGASLRCDETVRIILTGAPAPQARIMPMGTPVPMWRPFTLDASAELHIGPLTSGVRTYMCPAGGITTPTVLGSRSTHIATGLGSTTGAACAPGDHLPIGSPATNPSIETSSKHLLALIRELNRRTFRVVRSPHATTFSGEIWSQFIEKEWEISRHSDRIGTRLDGLHLSNFAANMRTDGACIGAIQVPPNGQPIVLGVDSAPTGGYPIIASVIAADMSAFAQRRPNEGIHFEEITIQQAQHVARQHEQQLDHAVSLHADAAHHATSLNGVTSIDLNADMAERGMAHIKEDVALLDHVTSINVACGQHAGDEPTARAIIQRALQQHCAIGAHPSYPDRTHFGRKQLDMSPAAIEECIHKQLLWLMRIVADEGGSLRHVKPHGALYHSAHTDSNIATAIGSAVHRVNPRLILIGGAGSRALAHWRAMRLRVASEGFADRAYEPDGTLRARTHHDALITTPSIAGKQAASIACGGEVRAHDGSRVVLTCETICIHSDTPNALAIARAVRSSLLARGVHITPIQCSHESA